VHDLLYRPQDTPEEAVLEAILAGLASVFSRVQRAAGVRPRRSGRSGPPALVASVKTMVAARAREICGDCVPREFRAGACGTWMDRIQRLAGDVEQI